ncbi:hypothetical protein HAX54_049493 [Datura stramonium]|uniref:Uncharacterized protein n=1 Tax=Datura stramonium TaxID=4076 RepID=A0ABS8RQN1_DATST|nr:hypothetical protein [Datura stramonium]
MGSRQHIEQRSKAIFIYSNVDSAQGQAAGFYQQLETVQQVYMQKNLNGKGNLVEGSSQDQSSRSKSKNKLSKKRRDAIKKKMEVEKGMSKPNPYLMVDESSDTSISPSHDNQHKSMESQKSKAHSQQSKCFQQSKHDTQANLLNVYIQERINSMPIQTDQVDTSKRKGEVSQQERNKEGVGTNCISVNKQADLTMSPLQTHESPPRECTLNSIPTMLDELDDEYRVIHSEDEFDQDSQYIGDQEVEDEEEEETSKQVIRTFGPTVHSEQQNEIQQASAKQGLSPRKHQDKAQSSIIATASTSVKPSRPITRSQSQSF